ncbi:MAG TPA: hypothetical protein VGO08_23870 [Burkholderiales bacterium]|nr:hypothetical protein [Burkholderiales bacterium]
MSTITVWMIVVLMNSGHRVELSDTHPSELDCLAAAEAIQSSHPGASAACIARPIALSENQAKRLSSEDWWRNRPREAEADRKP